MSVRVESCKRVVVSSGQVSSGNEMDLYTSEVLEPGLSPPEQLGRILREFHSSLNAGNGHVNSTIVIKASPPKKKSRFPHSLDGLAAAGCSILLAYQDGFVDPLCTQCGAKKHTEVEY